VVAARVPATVAVVEAAGERQCVLTSGSDSLDAIALHLALLDIPFTPLDSPPGSATAARRSPTASVRPPPAPRH
jgi:hypothetical protein